MSGEQQTIQQLVEGCKANDRKAQETLYRSYYKVMMNLCLRYTKKEADASEALNSGFYKVLKNIKQFDPKKATLYTWIRTIIINSCLDIVKKTSQPLSDPKELEQAATINVPPAVFEAMSADEILFMVRKLPTATQTVFNLYVIEGYTHTEIAKLTGISEGTSKWHLSEARKRLQDIINKRTGQ